MIWLKFYLTLKYQDYSQVESIVILLLLSCHTEISLQYFHFTMILSKSKYSKTSSKMSVLTLVFLII